MSTPEVPASITPNPTVYHNGVTEFTRLVWENGRQLVELEMVPAANKEYTVNYSYDADGIRSQKVVTATLGTGGTVRHDYITQGGKVIRETITHGSSVQVLDFIYDTSGQPYALNYSTDGGSTFTTYYYVLNLQGDVVELIDDAGTTVAEYSYNAWGEIITATGTMAEINPLRYRGYYYDAETGFYYLQSRYYDPVVKRFINADTYQSTGQGFVGTNMFAYCGNNPVIYADHSGEGLISALFISLVVAATSVGFSYAAAQEAGEEYTGWDAAADGAIAIIKFHWGAATWVFAVNDTLEAIYFADANDMGEAGVYYVLVKGVCAVGVPINTNSLLLSATGDVFVTQLETQADIHANRYIEQGKQTAQNSTTSLEEKMKNAKRGITGGFGMTPSLMAMW